MTYQQLNYIGQEILQGWTKDRKKEEIITIASRHGLSLNEDQIGEIPVRLRMQLSDGRWDESREYTWPLADYSTKAFSKLYYLYNQDKDSLNNVIHLALLLCFADSEEELVSWQCSKPECWKKCEVRWYYGRPKAIPTYRPNDSGGGDWYYEYEHDGCFKTTDRADIVPGTRIDPWKGKGVDKEPPMIVLDLTETSLTFSFKGQNYTVRYEKWLTIEEHIEVELD